MDKNNGGVTQEKMLEEFKRLYAEYAEMREAYEFNETAYAKLEAAYEELYGKHKKLGAAYQELDAYCDKLYASNEKNVNTINQLKDIIEMLRKYYPEDKKTMIDDDDDVLSSSSEEEEDVPIKVVDEDSDDDDDDDPPPPLVDKFRKASSNRRPGLGDEDIATLMELFPVGGAASKARCPLGVSWASQHNEQ